MGDEQNKVGEYFLSHTDSVMVLQQGYIPLCEIFHGTKLLFVFSGFICQPCVDNQIETLNGLYKDIKKDNVIILAVNFRCHSYAPNGHSPLKIQKYVKKIAIHFMLVLPCHIV